MDKSSLFFIFILILFVILVQSVLEIDYVLQPYSSKPVAELTQAIGYSGLSLSSDCTYTLNPILEGTCQTDVPGGYCYHESCGMVNPTADGTPYSLKVTHVGNDSAR